MYVYVIAPKSAGPQHTTTQNNWKSNNNLTFYTIKHKIFALLAVLICSTTLFAAYKEVKVDRISVSRNGTCGDNIHWTLNGDSTLTISGTGAIATYSHLKAIVLDWDEIRSQATSIMIDHGITAIGDSVFYDCKQLRHLSLPEGLLSIGNFAFMSDSALISVTIPQSVTFVGKCAFCWCDSLSSIYYNGTIEEWCNHNFSGLMDSWNGGDLYIAGKEVTDLVIPEGVTNIPVSAFQGCTSLISVVIPSTLTDIDSYAFKGCTSLESITIPKNIPNVDIFGAFKGCENLSSIHYNGTLRDWCLEEKQHIIGEILLRGGDFFINGDKVTDIIIPNGIKKINDNTFSGCLSLESVTLPNSVKDVGVAFDGCINLESPIYNAHLFVRLPLNYKGEYILPEGITTIAPDAFAGCDRLTSVILPQSIREIGSGAFQNCGNLKSINLPNSIWKIGHGVFRGCGSLTQPLYNSHLFAFMPSSYTGSYTIPNGIHTICHNAFEACSKLTAVTIPESVEEAGELVFGWCSGLTSPVYNSHLFLYFPEQYDSFEYKIPEGIRTIADGAFWDCGERLITIPSSVQRVGYLESKNEGIDIDIISYVDDPSCFKNVWGDVLNPCTIYVPTKNLQRYRKAFDDRIASFTIQEFAWDYEPVQIKDLYYNLDTVNKTAEVTYRNSNANRSITTATIPSVLIYEDSVYSVTSIGEYAFQGCKSLESVEIPYSVTSIGECAFGKCKIRAVTWNAKNGPNFNFGNRVKSFTFGNKVEVIPSALCSGMNKLMSITIPNNVTSIGDGAFYGCKRLTSITIPNSVTSIGHGVFYDCKSLTAIEISNSVASIGIAAFRGCESLKSIVIPDSVTSIGDGAFFGCKRLTSITIPNSVTGIGNVAFYGCESLKSIVIPDSVTNIGDGAFYGCKSLTSIEISNSVASIGKGAFLGCKSLTSITIPNSVTSIGHGAFYGCKSLTTAYVPEDIEIEASSFPRSTKIIYY